MATTSSEARKIIEIINDFLPEDKVKELTVRLNKEVGEKTDNESLKMTLNMFRVMS